MGYRRPRAKQVAVDAAAFVNAYDPTIDDAKAAFDRTDIRVEPLLVLPSQDLAAIVNAAANGSSFILASGTHTLTAIIAFDGKADISIRGPRTAVITIAAGTAIDLCSNNAVFAQRIVLEGFTLRGNNTNGAANLSMRGTVNNGDHVIRGLRFESPGPNSNKPIRVFDSLRDTQIVNCEFEGYFSYGVQAQAGAGDVIDHLQILGCKFETLYVDADGAIFLTGDPASHAVVADNVIYGGNWNRGISLVEVRDSVIVGNTIDGTDGEGIRCAHAGALRNVISNNVLYDVAKDANRDGILVTGASGTASYHIIGENIIFSPSRRGISVGATESVTVEYNTVVDAGEDGIYLSDVDESTISGNMVKGAVGNGLNELGTCDQNLYVGNHLRGNGAATALAGTNRTFSGNKV